MSHRPRLALVATAGLGLVVGLALGVGSVLAQQPSATPIPGTVVGTAATMPPPPAGTPGAGTTTAATSGPSGIGVAGTAIAYPVYPGTPGLAPDHTIVVTGVGQAEMKTDGSNRAAAERTALQAALADAKGQSETVATATGLSITGVLSVSTSISPYGFVSPMAARSGAPSAPLPGADMPSPSYLTASVTIAYRVG